MIIIQNGITGIGKVRFITGKGKHSGMQFSLIKQKMMEYLKRLRIFNGNGLKILAAALMFIDHIGLLLFPDEAWLRFIGRLSMPLFAFMIAEGCRYTKNKYKHFFLLFGLGAACQLVYFIFDPKSVYLGILLTFSISTLIIYAMQYVKKCFLEKGEKTAHKIAAVLLLVLLIAGAFTLCCFVLVDYGFWGIMMPVFASIFDFHRIPAPVEWQKLDCLPIKVLCMAVAEIFLIVTYYAPLFQLPALLAFPLLLLYNGEKGKANLKYFFYVFYPLHLGLLQGILFLLA